MCLIAHKTNEFREIDVSRTPYTALGTCQTVPDGAIGWLFQFIKGALNDLPGRKIREDPGYRTTAGAYTAVKAVIGICGFDQFSYRSHYKASVFLSILTPLF